MPNNVKSWIWKDSKNITTIPEGTELIIDVTKYGQEEISFQYSNNTTISIRYSNNSLYSVLTNQTGIKNIQYANCPTANEYIAIFTNGKIETEAEANGWNNVFAEQTEEILQKMFFDKKVPVEIKLEIAYIYCTEKTLKNFVNKYLSKHPQSAGQTFTDMTCAQINTETSNDAVIELYNFAHKYHNGYFNSYYFPLYVPYKLIKDFSMDEKIRLNNTGDFFKCLIVGTDNMLFGDNCQNAIETLTSGVEFSYDTQYVISYPDSEGTDQDRLKSILSSSSNTQNSYYVLLNWFGNGNGGIDTEKLSNALKKIGIKNYGGKLAEILWYPYSIYKPENN